METVLAVSAIVVLGWFAVALLLRRALRALRHHVSSAGGRALLAAQAYGIGPAAEVARLRRDLGRAVTSARRALVAAREVHAPVGDVPTLLARLELAAQAVDGELRMLEALPDGNRIVSRIAGPRSRAEAIMSCAAQLVDGLLHAAGHQAGELGVLQAACAIEADALHAASRDRIGGWLTSPRSPTSP